MTDSDPTTELAVLREVANGLVSKAVEAVILLHTGDQMFAATVGGGAGGTVQAVIDGIQRFWTRRRERAAEFLEAARDEAGGLTTDELFARALDHDDERRLDLLVTALRAAVEDGQKELVRFYGRIAASGLLAADDAKVDLAARVFSTLAAMDVLELKTLLLITEPGQPADWHVTTSAPIPDAASRGVLLDAMPQLEGVIDSVVSALEGAGLISTRTQAGPNFGGPDFRVTSYAHTCRAELDRGEGAGS